MARWSASWLLSMASRDLARPGEFVIRAEAEDLEQQSQISLCLRARSIVRVTMPHPSGDGRSARRPYDDIIGFSMKA